MPRRKHKGRSRRINDQLVAELSELIRIGRPWNIDNKYHRDRGHFELCGLVTGHFYFSELFDANDEDAQQGLYELLEAEFVPAHAHYRPGLRPWAWWKWTAPEPRKPVERFFDEGDDRLPAVQECWAEGEIYFGKPSFFDGWVYESEYDFLARLNLLLPEETAVFAKFDCVTNVHVAMGEFGKCPPCWEQARETAKRIDFDLDAAIKRWEFWVPGDLLFRCEHREWGNESIFTEVD